jgi:hypothetical protein
MKLASCPWCGGEGQIFMPDPNYPGNISNKIGVITRMAFVDCTRRLIAG